MIPVLSAINAALGNVVRLGFTRPWVRGALGVSDRTVSDERFFDQLTSVRELKHFLFSERVSFESGFESISLGPLDFIEFHAYGRTPTEEEWNLLDRKLTALASLLTLDLRRKLRIWELRFYFRTLPLYFLGSAILALSFAFIFYDSFGAGVEAAWWFRFPAFGAVVLWTLALGGLGACGFLGTALLNQSAVPPRSSGEVSAGAIDKVAEIDLTDRDLLRTRIVVGILFAFLLGLPFSYRSLWSIIAPFIDEPRKAEADLYQIPRLLAPFVLGYSTTLVLTIMDRLISAIRSIFGVSPTRP